MGITVQLRSVSEFELHEMKASPTYLSEVLLGEIQESSDALLPIMEKMTAFGMKLHRSPNDEQLRREYDKLLKQSVQHLPKHMKVHLPAEVFDEPVVPDMNLIDLDKSWQGLHMLLTGTVDAGEPPLKYAIFGDKEFKVSHGDWGYGPPRYVSPVQVKEIADILEKVSADELRSRFDWENMQSTTLQAMGREDAEYMTLWYNRLRDFYVHARESGNAAVCMFT